jgi:anaerobic selenocysteine-containing dehydrogenase
LGPCLLRDEVEPALLGTFAITLPDGKAIACRPALELLRALAAQHSPERSEAITWVPAESVRGAVRLFATEKPSFYSTWVGLEQHTNAMQTNAAIDPISASVQHRSQMCRVRKES